MRETTSEVPLVALKGADQLIRERFLKNMSKRAAQMLREDMQLRGPAHLVEVSQQQPGGGQQTPQQERSGGGDARGSDGMGLDAPLSGERGCG